MSVQAFDLAERFQTPVFVVSDLDIGMNDWMCERLTWDDAYRPDRGKVMDAAQLEAATERFSRYFDRDGDGVAARSLPGVHPKGAFFTRGSGHDKHAAYTEDSDAYQEVVDRLARKLATAAGAVPTAELRKVPGVDVGIITIGGCRAGVLEAVDMLRAQGIGLDYMRVRGFPFGAEITEFLESHERCYVVEQNRDAQLRSLLTIETGFARDRMIPILSYNGLPLTADEVATAVLQQTQTVPA